jgi:hypothetical protein
MLADGPWKPFPHKTIELPAPERNPTREPARTADRRTQAGPL